VRLENTCSYQDFVCRKEAEAPVRAASQLEKVEQEFEKLNSVWFAGNGTAANIVHTKSSPAKQVWRS